MRKVQTLRKTPYPAPDVVTKVVPVPTEGWDAISPLASMDPKRAPILTNWVPRPGFVELRSGFSNWVTLNLAQPVETLMTWRSPSVERFFAAMGDGIYDVSIRNTFNKDVAGMASARWQYINFTPANAPTVLQCVNGIDTMHMYNGAWSVPAISGLPGGLNTSCIRNIAATKRRLWYVLGDGSGGGTTKAAFMPTDAITGPIAGVLDIGALLTKGGNLVQVGSWTVDGGAGPQDYTVLLSSRGQAVIYAGTDPANALNWSLVGTFDMSPPVSLRCMTRIGSDLALITQDGVLPISQALPFDPSADRSVAITARIQHAMATATTLYKDHFGWQFITFPAQQLSILNIPVQENSEQIQYVMNSLTGAWCNFSGWNANVFEVYGDDFYFGGNDGTVNVAWDGGLDGGEAILANMQCAFNYFDDPGRLKRMTMVQPLMVVSSPLSPTISVDEDFHVSDAVAPISILITGDTWNGTGIWDVSTWPIGAGVFNPWLSTEAIGHALAIHMTVNAGGTDPSPVTLQINAFNAIMELGGFV